MIKNKHFFYCLLAFSLLINAEFSAMPGELIAIKLEKAIENLPSNELIVESGPDKVIIIPIPHNKTSFYIDLYDIKINVQTKDFGESRITINNLSQVNLNKEDAERAYKESLLIKDAVKTYSYNFKPLLNFISPVEGIISSRYGKKRFINDSPRSPHLALDIAAPEGSAVIAPAYGKVILTGNFFYGGNYIIIDHGYGMLSSYSHLSEILVSKGDLLSQSDLIGKVGSTGRVTGPHLHWTVYLNEIRINPESLLKENYLSTLLESI